MKKIKAFSFYGGKLSHLKWLLPLIPVDRIYAEPFCGSASIILNREKSDVECINDIDGRIVNFFKMLRECPDEMIRLLSLTPYSRKNFNDCAEYLRSNPIDKDPLESARCFFIVTQQGFGSFTTDRPRWARTLKHTSRNMVKHVSAYLSKVDGLMDVVMRLKTVLIENKDALEFIQEIDSDETVFYCDPPYVHDTRTSIGEYKYEQDNEFHRKLCNLLDKCDGKVVLSGYDNEIYNSILTDWNKIESPVKSMHRSVRIETVWCNF